jgi:hypothetical protein
MDPYAKCRAPIGRRGGEGVMSTEQLIPYSEIRHELEAAESVDVLGEAKAQIEAATAYARRQRMRPAVLEGVELSRRCERRIGQVLAATVTRRPRHVDGDDMSTRLPEAITATSRPPGRGSPRSPRTGSRRSSRSAVRPMRRRTSPRCWHSSGPSPRRRTAASPPRLRPPTPARSPALTPKSTSRPPSSSARPQSPPPPAQATPRRPRGTCRRLR